MDHSWRPRPVQGNICPICSISHFPFCPPHPSFDQNPRYQSHNSLQFQRPYFDPFIDHRGPIASPHRPFIANPIDGFGDPRPWYVKPSLERESFAQMHGQSHRYDFGGVGVKRMRVDETGVVGSFASENYASLPRISEENERRLKLIRDHGGLNSEPKGSDQDSLGFDRSFGNTDMASKPPRNFEMNNFDRKENFSHKDDHGLASAPQYTLSSRNERLGQVGNENSLNPLLQMNVHKGLPIGGYNNVNHGQGIDPFHNEGAIEHRSNNPIEVQNHYNQLPQPYSLQHPMQPKYDFRSSGQLSEMRQSFEVNVPLQDRNQGRVGHSNFPSISKYGNNMVLEDMERMESSRGFNIRPPLPTSPPPPLPGHSVSPPRPSSSLFSIHLSSLATASTSYPPVADQTFTQPSIHNKPHLRPPAGFATEESQANQRMPSNQYSGESRQFPPRQLSLDKPKVVDASHIFNQPHRAQRPDHIVIILRGLPGSGKSYFAKMLRDIEVENGGDAPRIHSLDEYFMTEVEDNEVSKSSASGRGKKPVTKKVMEYCYEPEMEEAYRSSMLKAFKKTLEEGVFCFIIVDDRNLRVADFAQFWAIAKRSGFEVYLLEATYKDPAGCAARNVHGFTQDEIERMAGQWEEAPSLYLRLDIKSLFHGDDLKESGIEEYLPHLKSEMPIIHKEKSQSYFGETLAPLVDMDTEDGGSDCGLSGFEDRNSEKIIGPPEEENAPEDLLSWYCGNYGDESSSCRRKFSGGSSKDVKGRNAEKDHPIEVNELGRSKWSANIDEDDVQRTEASKGKLNSLSGLVQAYGKEGKSVHWADQVENTGFSIGAAKKASTLSLVIGPGAGYNLKSNPLSEDVNLTTPNSGEPKGRSVFQEQIRAEHESFRVVFDKRKRRIRGLNVEDE